MTYALRREEALILLEEYASPDGMIRLSMVRDVLLSPAISDADIAWAYRKARGLGLLPPGMAVDPRTVQLLAMDT